PGISVSPAPCTRRAKRQSAVAKHALSETLAPGIEARTQRCARSATVLPRAPTRCRPAPLVAQTLKKKAFAHQLKTKKCLRNPSGVLFFAPTDMRGRHRAQRHYIRGVAENGEERWRTDEVGSSDSD